MTARRTIPPLVAEIVPPGTAKALDMRLRHQARAFDHSWGRLEPLIAEAKAREIHAELGFKSWPDYIADVARTEMPNVARSVEQRREIVAMLAGEGMSNRAIADAVGVNEITVRRDKDEVRHNVAPDTEDVAPEPVHEWDEATLARLLELDKRIDDADMAAYGELQSVTDDEEPRTVTGRDGKSYPAKPPVTKARKLTAAEAQGRRIDAVINGLGAINREAGSICDSGLDTGITSEAAFDLRNRLSEAMTDLFNLDVLLLDRYQGKQR